MTGIAPARNSTPPSSASGICLIAGILNLSSIPLGSWPSQQTRLGRCLPGPSLKRMSEGADFLVTEEPSDARDRETCIPKIVPGKVRSHLLGDPRKGQVFIGKPPGECPSAHPEPLRNLANPRLAVR